MPSAVATRDARAEPPAANVGALAARPGGGSTTKFAAVPPKERPVADGWRRVDLAQALIDVPETWNAAESDRSKGTGSWYVGTPPKDMTLMAGMLRGMAKDMERLRSQTSVEEERKLTVDGRPATLVRGTGPKLPGMTVWMVTLDSPEADGTTFAWLVSVREGNALEMSRTVEDLLGSVRFVASPTAGGDATSEEIQRAHTTLTPVDVLEVVALGGSKGVGWTVTLRPEPVSPAGLAPRPAPPPQTVGADGVARFTGVPAGSWGVTVSGPDGAERPFVGPIPVGGNPKGNPRLVLGLGTATVEGRVFSREGSLLADHALRFITTRDITDTPKVVHTDAQGRYRLTDLRSDGYQYRDVLVARDGMDLETREGFVAISPGEKRTLDIGSPSAEPRWTGALRLVSGTALRGPMSISLLPATGGSAQSVTIEDPGHVSQRIPPGAYRIWLSPRGLMKSPPPFPFAMPEQDTALDITVPGVRVSGVLRDGATGRAFPIPDPKSWPRIELIPLDSAGAGASATGIPDADGSYVLEGIPAGRYRATAWPPYGRTGKSTSVDVVVPTDQDVGGIDLVLKLD